MLAHELKEKYIGFFMGKGHASIESSSLIPENDPTVLFTTAGMHPLVPFLLGQKHPLGKRLVDVQKCLRTDDIDEVGDQFHLTFFQMLGNWSLGDYFKKETIEWSFEFLTKVLGIPEKKISVSVFAGDNDAPRDEESARIWLSVGVPKERIFYFSKKENWWGPAGKTGPCGPCTEMFFDTGKDKCSKDCDPSCSCGKYAEIWNDVFMEYGKINRTMLVDGMGCLYDESFKINEELLNLVKSAGAKAILVVDGFKKEADDILREHEIEVFQIDGVKKENKEFFEKLMEKYGVSPEQLIYIDHKKENVESAKQNGIMSEIYTDNKKAKEFIEGNIHAFVKLQQRNVDTGMGFERTLAVLNGKDNVYETELFEPIINGIRKISETVNVKSERIIADHLRAAAFVLAENIRPSNVGHGYILRRLIRRAIRHGRLIGIRESFTKTVAGVVIEIYSDAYPELRKNKDFILDEMEKEERRFVEVIEKGLKYFGRLDPKDGRVGGKEAFLLFQSFGLPIEVTKELAAERNLAVDEAGFEEEYRKHQDTSRKSMEGVFKSGLQDHGTQSVKYHTATHLLHQALRDVLGSHVLQKGSNITSERLRFDFSHPRKMTEEELNMVEGIVNEKISDALPVKREEMPPEDAKKLGAIGLFGEKYGNRVSVYSVGNFSKEICTGPHVQNTKDLGHFRIVKEEAVSAGVRRIKAVLE